MITQSGRLRTTSAESLLLKYKSYIELFNKASEVRGFFLGQELEKRTSLSGGGTPKTEALDDTDSDAISKAGDELDRRNTEILTLKSTRFTERSVILASRMINRISYIHLSISQSEYLDALINRAVMSLEIQESPNQKRQPVAKNYYQSLTQINSQKNGYPPITARQRGRSGLGKGPD
jgi:hypothetical protein